MSERAPDIFDEIVAAELAELRDTTLHDQLDPALRSIIADAQELEKRCNDHDEDIIEYAKEFLSEINNELDYLQYDQNLKVYLSGEAARADCDFEESSEEDYLPLAAAEPVILVAREIIYGEFYFRQSDDSEKILYFRAVVQLEDEVAKIALPLKNIMYMELSEPSEEVWEAYLHDSYPEMMAELNRTLDFDATDEKKLLEALHKLQVRFERDHQPTARYTRKQQVEWLEEYVRDRLCLTDDLYQVTVEGVVHRVKEGGEEESDGHYIDEPRTFLARLEAIRFEDKKNTPPEFDHNVYESHVLVRVPQPHGEHHKEYYMPTESIRRLTNLYTPTDLFEEK